MQLADWLTCTDPARMLEFLRIHDGRPLRQQPPLASDRRLRLWACACCRSPEVWALLTDARSRRAVEVAERFADGLATEEERSNAAMAAHDAYALVPAPTFPPGQYGAGMNATAAACNACWHDDQSRAVLVETHQAGMPKAAQAALLRSIVNPFAPALPDGCRTPLVRSLAEGAYARKDRCPTCKGRGMYYVHNDGYLAGDVICRDCDGTGEVDRSDGSLCAFRLGLVADALEDTGLSGEREHDWMPSGFASATAPCRRCGVEWATDGHRRHGNICQPVHPLLAALREPVARFRGFWVLDQILSKE
jgi:hypothetical protein